MINSIFYLFWQSITKKYFQLKGRANRKEYMIFLGIYFLLYYMFDTIDVTAEQTFLKTFLYLLIVISLVFLTIPSITIMVRRLHDLNLNGFWFFLDIPIITVLYLINFPSVLITWSFSLILLFFKGTSGANKYGEEPVN